VSSKCFQLYYTCSDILLAVVLPPCPFHLFTPHTVTFPKLAVILRPLYGRKVLIVAYLQERIFSGCNALRRVAADWISRLHLCVNHNGGHTEQIL
jgi:hypothetical protein